MHAMHSFVITWFDAIKEKALNALIIMAFYYLHAINCNLRQCT